MQNSTIRIAIGIATAGRREVLSDTFPFLLHQDRPADEILICPANSSDVDEEHILATGLNVRVIAGAKGLPHQRNAILAQTTADIVVFLDDDFLPAADFIREVEALFRMHPKIVVATGNVIADGILGPGLTMDEAVSILKVAGTTPATSPFDVNNAYGCNMVVRTEVVRQNNLKFDESLPLYAWLEDLDFSRQLSPYGRIVKAPRLRGVHLGTKKSGRSPGRRLGYSQIANPIYLAKKGTMPWRSATRQIARNCVANFARSFSPEPWIDRRGRLRGNLQAIFELLAGRLSTRRILDLG